ncbi:hypothetical protein [Nocardioides astragali]|uniref:Transmembrane protein n=1 Tax=Nocardioides astragali TaxID=1776736 RepID=A0ABW2MWX8_9ACTN|nr:hypothetical protein [Nocardioides astragali]
MRRSLAWTLVGAGVIAMSVSSLWAPPQPELLQDGGACEISLCGTLEDPARWRAAWWLWAAGLCVLAIAIPLASRPRRVRPLWVVLAVVTAPGWLVGYAVIAWMVSLWTSVQGAATVFACGVLAPFLSVLTGALKRGSSRPVAAGERFQDEQGS